ncbi:MAG: hypothetical protein AAFN11_09875, partial [Chloroflexota bacterium]
NADRTVVDEWPTTDGDGAIGTLTIKPLANNDAALYPPLIGADSDDTAQENHYLVSGYAATAISDDNNPYITIRNELEEHFGLNEGYGNCVAFIHTDQVAATEALADFVDVTDVVVTPGDDTATVNGLPNVPGRIIGRVSGVWVSEWRYIPSGYILGTDLDQPAPTKVRVHRSEYGLPQALALVSEDERHPIMTRNYEHDMGVGVGNRLNGVIVQLKASGSYDIPSRYAR